MINVSRSIPCRLTEQQVEIVMRDICRTINFNYPDKTIAQAHRSGLQCSSGWHELPEWLKSAELQVLDNILKLDLCAEDTTDAQAAVDVLADKLLEELSSLFCYPTRPYPTKVFCLGWSKTGTTSLTQALRMLGLFSWHSSPWMINTAGLSHHISVADIDFPAIADYTALSDLPVCALFREMDQAFPGSKFILTVRPAEKWLDSLIFAMQDYNDGKQVFEPEAQVINWAYGTKKFDEQVFLQRYLAHNQQVQEYFQGRPDLLILDVAEADPWQKLCAFLNLPVPDSGFPHSNKRVLG